MNSIFPSSLEDFVQGLKLMSASYAFIFILHLLLPGQKVDGYAVDYATRKPLKYRLNGLVVLCTTLAALINFYPAFFTQAALSFGACVQAANVLGLSVSSVFYLRGKWLNSEGKITKDRRALTTDSANEQQKPSIKEVEEFDKVPAIARFYLGYEWNPRYFSEGRLDFKMFLYIVGAVQLAINLYAAYYYALKSAENASGAPTIYLAFLCYQIMLSIFIIEYLYFEYVHIYTYDIFCERVGFKLVWGCMCFYPFFYCIGAWSVAEAWRNGAADISQRQFALILFIYCIGWVLTRGLIQQRFVAGSGKRLLCSGFWALSQHINYLGEIVQAIALALPGFFVSGSIIPFLYPLYYIALLLPRALQDAKICRRKYGETVWRNYTSEVKYHVIPYVF